MRDFVEKMNDQPSYCSHSRFPLSWFNLTNPTGPYMFHNLYPDELRNCKLFVIRSDGCSLKTRFVAMVIL